MSKRVVVAMSGGVDSSAAASLLVEQGYEVIGLTMQTWPARSIERSGGKQRGCCGVDAARDAFSVCNLLGIPHYVLNFQEVFQKEVIDDFTKEYLSGRTPNPCVRCNEFIKFKSLLGKAVSLGADYLATGHYAKTVYDPAKKRYCLLKGKDEKKDQSYVLYPLKQEELEKTLFPLGDWTKEEVRAYAKEKKLPTAEKSDSYDLCFVPDGKYEEFIQKETENLISPGKILNQKGETLGNHRGIPFYTIGQRKGLGVSSKDPLFVLSVHPETNTLVVGREEELYCAALFAEKINWVSIHPPEKELRATARIRYHAIETEVSIAPISKEKARITFAAPQKAVTPGQSVVFYEKDEVLGGGTIFIPADGKEPNKTLTNTF
ncbi:MAG: tRNA 2-thiouridine(34) synthase MnmA [Candidatus Eremiobacteraeota bacterium]|nr:tRNA 2-thiouridine(34) synthase MnmA [Candidatus Eremiobacteraeota bacterium]MCL5055445.1 tRNA 2-thiouridine(34) synthase MnmA [Bacillota bacterium]